MSLFPIIQPNPVPTLTELPVYVDVMWDYERDTPVFENDEPVMIRGADAVAVWAWNALHTERRLYEIWTWEYGDDLYTLIGQPYTDDLKRAEAMRYVKECLTASPYIRDVREIMVDFEDDKLSISCTITTIYGEVKL